MIAIVYPQFYGVGGIARYLDSFLSNLPVNAPPVVLVTGDENIQPRTYRGVKIVHVPFTSSRFSLFTWGLAVRKLLLNLHRRGEVQVVNFHFPPLIPGLFLPRKIPMVLTAHTTYLGMSGRFTPERHFASPWGPLSVAIKQWMERRIFAKAREVIALTEQGHQEVLAYGYAKPVHVIPNGVDLREFQVGARTVKDIDVLLVGRIEVRKGSRAVPALCQALLKRKPDLNITIVGYGDDEAWVREALAPLGPQVHMAGKVPLAEVSGYYRRAKVYAATSYYEGLPGTCLEAMAMELPPVVWDLLFYRGLVEPGRTGERVAVNQIDKMAEEVLALVSDPQRCAHIGQAARNHLRRGYDWAQLADQITARLVASANQ
jgi:glycosyltransferase involved in cell wall biosynthesis